MAFLLMLVTDQEVKFGAFIRLGIAIHAQTIELVCQHLLCTQTATGIFRKLIYSRNTRIMEVIIRKERSIMAVGTVRLSDEQF